MPGYIHGLIQVEFSILVKDGVRTGRERGMSEGAGLPYSHRLPGQPPASSPLTPVSWEQDQLWLDPPPPKLNKSATGFLEGTPVSFLATSLNDHKNSFPSPCLHLKSDMDASPLNPRHHSLNTYMA